MTAAAFEAVCARLGALEDRDEQLVARVVRLEQQLADVRSTTSGARDNRDVALVVAIVSSVGDHSLAARGLFLHRRPNPALAAALLEADVESAKQLGKLLSRCARGAPIAGSAARRVRLS
jgi:hypothetical protein